MTEMDKKTAEKVAIITGASRGIGKACALELARAGYDIAITYAGNEAAANDTVKEIEALGRKAKAYKFDVADKDACENAITQVFADFGRVDALINNAGITKDGLFMRMGADAWEAVINTNLNGVYYVTSPVAKAMIKQRSGVIINMSSVSGIYGNAGQANYSTAKAGLIGFTKSLAKELASRNIRVNAVAPGFIQTDMTKDLDGEKIAQAIPLKRLGQPEDIAKTVKFLCDDAPYITAQVISVDGGLVI